ncbi:MAG: hypothetical protein CO120_03925 [Gammaproteobacteria bacterium CG_4_9_14_3_um_filter_38_9]|nr:MAG: hypothetical protein CO120_03925 [Gammaproteobacteria bacterium CG_4_9_14_3_um_filter_38_9]
MKHEFYDIAFRKKIYHSVEQLQLDVDKWLKKYNEYRPHSGSRCYGKTPTQTFHNAKKLAIEAQLENQFESGHNAAETLQQKLYNRTQIILRLKKIYI